jgi:hypothetical protein
MIAPVQGWSLVGVMEISHVDVSTVWGITNILIVNFELNTV